MAGGASTLKRLRVRLKATDADTLAETFGSNVSENGVFLHAKERLPIGTPITFELLYHSGALALRGRGLVDSTEDHGMFLALDWAEESTHLLQWVIERTRPHGPDPFEAVTVYDPDPERSADSGDLEAPVMDDFPEQPTQPQYLIGSVHYLPIDARTMPTAPPPPVPPVELLVGQRPGSSDTWDLISDLIEPPVFARPIESEVKSDLERAAMADAFEETSAEDWGNSLYSGRSESREPGEVTPLARIELVRTTVPEPLRTGDIEPLDIPPDDEESGPRSTAILTKRAPAQLAAPSAAIMAIDLGTANTRAATIGDHHRARIIESRRGTDSTPSAVMIRDGGKTIIGEPALKKLPSHPQHGIMEVRRLLGLTFGSERVQQLIASSPCTIVPGEEGEVAVSLGGFEIAMEEIAALLLKEVRESALMALEQRVNRAVLTVPACFGVRQREAVRTAARLGGFHVESLISEAAAVAVHAATERKGGALFIYRLGAGTFDVSIVNATRDRVEVIASESELFLGGMDFDASLGVLLAEEVARISGIDPRSDRAWMAMVLESARKAKHTLSSQGRATVFVETPARGEASFRTEVELSRDQAELAWAPLIDRTLEMSERVLRSCGLSPADVDAVVVAGGQVRAPIVQKRLRAMFGRNPLDLDPERAAVLGAAELAARLGTDRELLVRDRLATSLFLAQRDLSAEPHLLSMRGSPLPATASFDMHTPQAMVCEGLNEDALEPIGVLRVEPFSGTAELRFEVSADGLLDVTAFDPGSRRELHVQLSTDLSQPYGSSPGGAPNGGLFGWIKKRFATAEK